MSSLTLQISVAVYTPHDKTPYTLYGMMRVCKFCMPENWRAPTALMYSTTSCILSSTLLSHT